MKTLILASAIATTLALSACGPREDPDRAPPEPATTQQPGAQQQPGTQAPGTQPGTQQQPAPTTGTTSGGQQPPMQQPPAQQPPMDGDPTAADANAERERQLENALRACGELPADARAQCEEDARRAADLEGADDEANQAGYGQPAPPPRANGG